MGDNLIEKLVDKTISKQQILEKLRKDEKLIPIVVNGMLSSKAAIRYGCGKVILDFSEESPEKLIKYFDFFVKILENKYRILIWQSMGIIANLTCVDKEEKFDLIFDKYFSFIKDEYMVTVANLVKYSGKIACCKPNLINKISNQLLKVKYLKTTPHLTEECKKVITESAITSFDMFFDKIENKEEIINFVRENLNSSRKNLDKKAKEFLIKWG